MKKWFLLLILLGFFVISCGETTSEKPVNKGLAAFKVEFAEDFDLGSPKNRRNDSGPIETTINITALGYDKQPLTDYNGKVEISMLYGEVEASKDKETTDITMTNGYLENVKVVMTNCLDYDRVVVDEVKTHEGDDTPKPTGKMGFSPVFYTNVATISAIQGHFRANKGRYSVFDGRNLTLQDRKMVVIAVMEGGFYLHEVNEDDRKEYSSIYMYTYSTPYVDDNIEKIEEMKTLPVGAIIESANGSVFEFAGFTEMSFPTFKAKYDKEGKIVTDLSLIPDPPAIISNFLPAFLEIHDGDHLSEEEIKKKKEDIAQHNDMAEDVLEKYESLIVKVEGVSVADFNEKGTSFVEYSQFPLIMNTTDKNIKQHILAQTVYTAPEFNPVDKKGKNQCYNFTGILKQHTGAQPTTWIIVPMTSYKNSEGKTINGIEEAECK